MTELVGGEQYVSCSVVLPALCHLFQVIEVSDDDPGYLCRFKEAFTADLLKWKESMNIQWLKVATVVDPRFKDLKCLSRSERDEVWRLIKELNAQYNKTHSHQKSKCASWLWTQMMKRRQQLILLWIGTEQKPPFLWRTVH